MMWLGLKFYCQEEVGHVREYDWQDFFSRFTSKGADEREGKIRFESGTRLPSVQAVAF